MRWDKLRLDEGAPSGDPGPQAVPLFGLDALGDELEEPFGRQSNAVSIKALADTVEINLREALGEKGLPELPAPIDYLLM